MRDIHALKEKNKKHPPLNMWAKKIKQIYDEAKAYTGPDPNTPIGLAVQQRREKQHLFEERLKKVCQHYVTRDVLMSTL